MSETATQREASPAAQRQSDRRTEILDAAERCFARAGFHRASMQDICGEAGMSPGNLYRYFPSKEALIAGICERNRADAVASFAQVDSAPDFFEGLAGLARHHLVDRTDAEIGLCAEIMAESRRHPEIAKLYQSIDIDPDAAATVLMVLGDGMSWRRSVDPKFDAERALPLILQMVHCLLAKQDNCAGNSAEPAR